jgi:hypothetical protein
MLPGDDEAFARIHMLYRLFRRTARHWPIRLRRGRRQIEVLSLQRVGHIELFARFDQRYAIDLRPVRFLLAAMNRVERADFGDDAAAGKHHERHAAKGAES